MGGIRHIAGISFLQYGINWVAQFSDDLNITLNDSGQYKCCLYDSRDGSEFPFKTVSAAKVFARRRRHGRSIEEHERAELLQSTRERMGWDVKTAAEKLGVSPRTVEAWFSGARPVPKMLNFALKGM